MDPIVARSVVYLALVGLAGIGLICWALILDGRDRRDDFAARYYTRTWTSR